MDLLTYCQIETAFGHDLGEIWCEINSWGGWNFILELFKVRTTPKGMIFERF